MVASALFWLVILALLTFYYGLRGVILCVVLFILTGIVFMPKQR